MKKKALIVDLDGTLMTTNTFNRFCTFIMKKWPLTLPVAMIALKRKLRLTSHPQAKQQILALAEQALGDEQASQFASKMIADYMRRSVKHIVDTEKMNGSMTLLATAAPNYYASEIARMAGFDGCVATLTGGNENQGYEKVRRVEEWLKENDVELGAVITDHSDDLPLMKLASLNKAVIWLVKPSEKTFLQARHLEPRVI